MKILIVEQDDFIIEVLSQAFEKVKFEVESINRPDETIVTKVKKIQPDLISMSMLFPELVGLELIKLLKQDTGTKDIPVFFLTNLTVDTYIQTGLLRGAVDYLSAPDFTPDELAERYTKYMKSPATYVPVAKKKKNFVEPDEQVTNTVTDQTVETKGESLVVQWATQIMGAISTGAKAFLKVVLWIIFVIMAISGFRQCLKKWTFDPPAASILRVAGL